MKKLVIITTLLILSVLNGRSQSLQPPDAIAETDSIILERLDRWQDLKFGFMMHWGIYAQWSIVESWSICNEPWIDNRGSEPYDDYKKRYFALGKSFNPTAFNSNKWADVAQKTGMKYVVFTTKHHDGFCMFNTKQTNYSVVGKDCPFSQNGNSDITKAVVDSFREKNFWIGLYFSKPDWHCEDYWSPLWATPDRNVNYDITSYPDKWKRYCDFTYNQIAELCTQYHPDILWLDGGWIRPEWSVNEESEHWLGCHKQIQDINMTAIAKMVRAEQPDMLIVDRSVGGKYENYRTPEQKVPESVLPYPWETCMTMGDSWSYVPNDNYKSVNSLIHLLVDVVAKGGNLLLNVGPDAAGNLPAEATSRMEAIGKWLEKNGKAIYGTRPVAPYKEGKICYTKSKSGEIYAIYLLDEQEELPCTISVFKNGTYKTIKVSRKQQMQNKGTHAVVFEL